MTIIPIQVTDEGVLIPKSYLRYAATFELIVTDEYVLVRPKEPATDTDLEQTEEAQLKQYSFIGIGELRNPNASVEAETILLESEAEWATLSPWEQQGLRDPILTDEEKQARVEWARKQWASIPLTSAQMLEIAMSDSLAEENLDL